MASLRLTFPEKDQPTVIALTGARLTIGRLPFNTIQIIDRTISGFHAELISEHGHYRLHDRGSSNGTFVNGQKIADFHLNEACTITFGNVEAQFSPEAVAANEEAESFPTRNEINAVRQENADLKATVAALREEIAALRLARPIDGSDAAMAVPRDEFEKVVVEREALKEAKLKQDDETARLRTDLAVLKRDRVNLQLAYDGVQRELVELRAKSGTVEETAVQPKAAAAALAAQAPSPSEEKPAEVPVPVAPPVAETPVVAPEPVAAEAPAPPAATPEPPAAPAESPAPAARPMPKPFKPLGAPAAPASLPKMPANPVGMPGNPVGMPSNPVGMPKPAPVAKAPAPAAPGAARPVPPSPANPPAPAKAPPGLGGAIRPKPAVPLTPDESLMEDENAQTMRITTSTPAPVPASKLPVAPTVKMKPIAPPQTGPKGTQKLS